MYPLCGWVAPLLLVLPFCCLCSLVENSINIENVRLNHQLDSEERQCCPCPKSDTDQGSTGSSDENSGSSSAPPTPGTVGVGDPELVGDCPCRTGEADCTPSGSSNIISEAPDTWILIRQPDENHENKTLLDPEVALASSVLETLREATEEKYEHALEKDTEVIPGEETDSSMSDLDLDQSDQFVNSMPRTYTIIIDPMNPITEKDTDSIHLQTEDTSELEITQENKLPSDITESHVKSEEISIDKDILDSNEGDFKGNNLKNVLQDLKSENKNKVNNVDTPKTNSMNKFNEASSKTSDSNVLVVKNGRNENQDTPNIAFDPPILDTTSLGADKFVDSKITRDDDTNFGKLSNHDQHQAGTSDIVININFNEPFKNEINRKNFSQATDFSESEENSEEENQESELRKLITVSRPNLKKKFSEDIVETTAHSTVDNEKTIYSDNTERLNIVTQTEKNQEKDQIMNFNTNQEIENEDKQTDLFPESSKSYIFDQSNFMKNVENEGNDERKGNINENTKICQNVGSCVISQDVRKTEDMKGDDKKDPNSSKTSINDFQRATDASLNQGIKKEIDIRNKKLIERMNSGEDFNGTIFSNEENLRFKTVNKTSNTRELFEPIKITDNNTISVDKSDITNDENVPEDSTGQEMNKTEIIENSETPKSNSNNNRSEHLNGEIPKFSTKNIDNMATDASDSIRDIIAPPHLFFRNLGKQSVTIPSLNNDLIVQPESLINNIRNKIMKNTATNIDQWKPIKLELPSIEELRSKVNDALGLPTLEQPFKLEKPVTKSTLLESIKSIRLLGEPQEKPVRNLNLDLFQLQPPVVNQVKSSQPSLKEKLENLHSYHLNIPLQHPIIVKPVAMKSTLRNNDGLMSATLALHPEPVEGKKSLSSFMESLSSPVKSKNVIPKLAHNKALTNVKEPKKIFLTGSKSLNSGISKKVETNPKTFKIPKLQPQLVKSQSSFDSKLMEASRTKTPDIGNRENNQMKSNEAIKNFNNIFENMFKSPKEVLGQENNQITKIQMPELKQNTLFSKSKSLHSSPESENIQKSPHTELRSLQRNLSPKKNLSFIDRTKPLDVSRKPFIDINEKLNDRKLKNAPNEFVQIKPFSPKFFKMSTAGSNMETNKVEPDTIQNQQDQTIQSRQAQKTSSKAPLNKQIMASNNERNLQQRTPNGDNNGNNQIVLYNNKKFESILTSILAKLISIDKNLSDMNLQQTTLNSNVNQGKWNIPGDKSIIPDPKMENREALKKYKRPSSIRLNAIKGLREYDAIADPTSNNEVKAIQKVGDSLKQMEARKANLFKSRNFDIGDETLAKSDTTKTTPNIILPESALLAKLKKSLDATTAKILENSSPRSLNLGGLSQKDMDDSSSDNVITSATRDETMQQNVTYQCKLTCANE